MAAEFSDAVSPVLATASLQVLLWWPLWLPLYLLASMSLTPSTPTPTTPTPTPTMLLTPLLPLLASEGVGTDLLAAAATSVVL